MYKFKKIIIMILLIIIFAFCSCKNNNISSGMDNVTNISSEINQKSIEDTDNVSVSDELHNVLDEEQTFKNMIKKETNKEILFWDYDDYDCNGENEAFAFTGQKNYDYMDGTLWLINSNRAAIVKDNIGCEVIFKFNVSDNTKYICLSYLTVNDYSLIWGVSGENIIETPVSNVGQNFTVIDNSNNFTIIQSAFDAMSLNGGHTRKPYYFYYDKGFHEYGGIKITIDDFLKYNNADTIVQGIKDKNNGTITSILKRSNDIININYSVPEREALQEFNWYYNMTLKVTGTSVEYIDENDGVYLPALVPDIAVY